MDKSTTLLGMLAKKYAPNNLNVVSAGMTPSSSELNQSVVKVIDEIRIDITLQQSKLLPDSMIEGTTLKFINMGCMDQKSCVSLFPKDVVINWSIPDPKEKLTDKVQKIRDQTKSEVIILIDSIENDL